MPRRRPPAAGLPDLPPRQAEALRAVRAFQARRGYPPTRAELGWLLGVSAQTADFHLRALARKGLLRLTRHARGVEILDARPPGAAPVPAIPVVGRVAAGRPLLALENLDGELPLPPGSGADFALRVQGDSMVEAGILDGDLVLVRRGADARPGDIVVALVGEGDTMEATVKRYLPGRGRVVLRPANPACEDLVIRRGDSFAIAGTVVGVLRLWG